MFFFNRVKKGVSSRERDVNMSDLKKKNKYQHMMMLSKKGDEWCRTGE
jgi:hypothetical protein